MCECCYGYIDDCIQCGGTCSTCGGTGAVDEKARRMTMNSKVGVPTKMPEPKICLECKTSLIWDTEVKDSWVEVFYGCEKCDLWWNFPQGDYQIEEG